MAAAVMRCPAVAPLAAAIAYLLCSMLLLRDAVAKKRSYVVYLGEHTNGSRLDDHGAAELAAVEERATGSHHDLLAGVIRDKEKAWEAIFYSYTKHINGIAANLDDAAAAEIAILPGVVLVFPNRGHSLHMMHSWQFLDLTGPTGASRGGAWQRDMFDTGTIIGNLDTGMHARAPSVAAPVHHYLTDNGATVKHTVKNVGLSRKYMASVHEPAGVRLAVSPWRLEFSKKAEEKSFEVKFYVKNATLAKDYSFGLLVWFKGKQSIRSSIVVKTA